MTVYEPLQRIPYLPAIWEHLTCREVVIYLPDELKCCRSRCLGNAYARCSRTGNTAATAGTTAAMDVTGIMVRGHSDNMRVWKERENFCHTCIEMGQRT